jgi:hypothetical protein
MFSKVSKFRKGGKFCYIIMLSTVETSKKFPDRFLKELLYNYWIFTELKSDQPKFHIFDGAVFVYYPYTYL